MRRSMRFLEWLIVIGLLALLAFGARAMQGGTPTLVAVLSSGLTTPGSTPTVVPTWTPTPTRTSSPSPTPTRTPKPTMTPTPETPHLPSPPVVLTDTGVITAVLPQPTPMPIIGQPKGTINVLLLGSDRREGEDVARTDVMMIASIFPDMPAVSLISIPRDYYAWIPTWGLDKINTAYLRGVKLNYPGGGPGMVKATVEYNFGIPIHYYAMVDFESYRSIVDAVGGVDLIVECPFHDTYPDPEVAAGQSDIDLEPGLHHLDGKYALWYVRSRWNTSDFDRHRRQQQVLRAVFRAGLSQNMIPRIPELWGVYQDEVETDMGLTEFAYLGSIATRLDMGDIKSRFIRGANLLTAMTAPNGGAVLAPNHDTLYAFMKEAIQPPVSSRASQRAYRVEVWNGTGNSGWGEVAAERLRLEGYAVTAIEQVELAPKTTLVDFMTTSKGSPLPKLVELYKLKPEDVTSEPTEGSAVEFRVILGRNYNPCAATVTGKWQPTLTPTPEGTPGPTPEGMLTPEATPTMEATPMPVDTPAPQP